MRPITLLVCLLVTVAIAPSGTAQSVHCDTNTWTSAQRTKIDTLFEQEIGLEDLELLDSAIVISKRMLDICPGYAPGLTTIAGLYGRLGKYNTEIEWARKAIDADSSYVNAYVNLANAYSLLGNREPAQRTFEEAARINPKSPFPAYGLGVLAEGDSRLEDAFDYYQKSIQTDSTFFNAYYNAAMIKARLGEKREALRYLHVVLKLVPGDGQVLKMIERLKEDIDDEETNPPAPASSKKL